MKTLLVQIDPDRPDPAAIEQAASILRGGGLVAFPTETVYGLGADALSRQAVRKIFEVKGRPADNPLIVHVTGGEMVSLVAADVGDKASKLIDAFWPGPLTLVLRRRPEVDPIVSAGLPTVAVRMPANTIALELIRRAATPVAAPSANISGRPSPTSARHVASDLNGRIDMIIDGGASLIGIESTVLDMTAEIPTILRPGWITREKLRATIGPVERAASVEEMKRSPGTRHRHYSPRARVVLVEQASPHFLERLCRDLLAAGPVAFIGHTPVEIDNAAFTRLILEASSGTYAGSIYAALRELDESGPHTIVVEAIADIGEGAAVMERLRRAASSVICEKESNHR